MSELRSSRNVRARVLRLSAALTFTCVALLTARATPAGAQPLSSQDPPAHVAVVDGDVVLDSGVDVDAADAGMPVVAGDRLRTRRGRVDLILPDGAAVDLDEYTEIEMQESGIIRLVDGRIRIAIPRESAARYRVDTEAATAYVDTAGDYRIAVVGSGSSMQTELAVTRGRAELAGDRGSVKLMDGERSVAWAGDVPSRPEAFNAVRYDAFDRWSQDQRDLRIGGASVQYLPPDLRTYGGVLDRDGSWQYEANYGYVWYPTVDVSWRPYYSGYWTSVPAYGWMWIGAERWSWPTHHYGRWGFARNRWFWIPDRRFAGAWVSWGAAPGYVSWCPLGFDNRPVFALSVVVGGSRTNGWVVLPRDRFGVSRERVSRFAIGPRDLSPRTPFIQQATPPVPARVFAQRSVTDRSRPDDRRAVPRDSYVLRGAPRGRETNAAPPSAAVETRRPQNRRPASGPTPRTGAAPDPGAPRAAASPRYPFGDFRRPNTSANDASAPPASPPVERPVDRPRGFNPRPRPDAQTQQQAQPPTQPQAPPAPAARTPEYRRRTDPQGNATPTAPPSYGVTRQPREGESRSGSSASAPRTERAEQPSVVGGRSGGNESSGSAGRQRGGESTPRSDGRSHDPASRRPPR